MTGLNEKKIGILRAGKPERKSSANTAYPIKDVLVFYLDSVAIYV